MFMQIFEKYLDNAAEWRITVSPERLDELQNLHCRAVMRRDHSYQRMDTEAHAREDNINATAPTTHTVWPRPRDRDLSSFCWGTLRIHEYMSACALQFA
mmetsp:Transcript_2930/g.4873  ORF Transcript_2930/g.4873 Transcript_2930/m.4873 type:complete len:99 (+) Transcript_2930:1163-1459(+)